MFTPGKRVCHWTLRNLFWKHTVGQYVVSSVTQVGYRRLGRSAWREYDMIDRAVPRRGDGLTPVFD